MRTLNVIPVPVGWSEELAWEAIRRDDLPLEHPEGEPAWAAIETDPDGRLIHVLDLDA